MSLSDDTFSRRCERKEKSSVHILCRCDVLRKYQEGEFGNIVDLHQFHLKKVEHCGLNQGSLSAWDFRNRGAKEIHSFIQSVSQILLSTFEHDYIGSFIYNSSQLQCMQFPEQSLAYQIPGLELEIYNKTTRKVLKSNRTLS